MNWSNGFNREWTQMDANEVAMVWESKMCFFNSRRLAFIRGSDGFRMVHG